MAGGGPIVRHVLVCDHRNSPHHASDGRCASSESYSLESSGGACGDPYREAIVLTELEGLTQKELAERLGISVSGAKSRVQRGREQLMEALLDCCKFEFDRRGRVIDCSPRNREGCPECS